MHAKETNSLGMTCILHIRTLWDLFWCWKSTERRTELSIPLVVKCLFLIKAIIPYLVSSCVQGTNTNLHISVTIQVADMTVLVYLLINQLVLLTLRSKQQNSELTSTHRHWGEATRRRNRSLTRSAETFTLAVRR